MKKKICFIAAVTILIIICAVIVNGIKEVGVMNQKESDPFLKRECDNRQLINQDKDQATIENVKEISGILECIDDSFYVDDTQLLFGRSEMIEKQASLFDYDSDEIIETIFGEINGLIGYSVNVKGHIIGENQIMVFEINGLPVGQPPHLPPAQHHEKGSMEGNTLIP